MAEASCSGTTPFKRLVDHQSRDASHHQDRFVDRSAVNGHGSFRSAAAAHAPDGFGAFIDGSPSSTGLAVRPHDAAAHLAIHAAALHPAPAHSDLSRAPVPDVSGWTADFSRFSGLQMRSTAPPMEQQPPPQLGFQAAFRQPPAALPPMMGRAGFMAPMPAEPDFDKEVARWMSSHGGGNMSVVDAAMDQMARELELDESASSAPATAALHNNPPAPLTDLETPEVGNLSLHEPGNSLAPLEPELAQDPLPEDAAATGRSAVSEAAERLLESVQHERGDKWQNSVFLSLMRDFRDGRKVVIDDRIQHVGELGGAGSEGQGLT